jgi:hypothetical protein
MLLFGVMITPDGNVGSYGIPGDAMPDYQSFPAAWTKA